MGKDRAKTSASISDLLPHLAWIYDGSTIPDPDGKGEAAVKFIRALRHPKSRLPGKAFALDFYQERITRRVFGDTKPDGSRKVRELLMIVGRGNRKTSLMAAYMLLFLVGPERRPYSEIMSAANSREQAGHIFKEMAAICRATPKLIEAVDIQPTAKAITYRKLQIRYSAISSDAKNAHGYTPIAACIDELAEAPKDELIEAIETGLNKSSNTILFLPTTSGVGQLGPLFEKYSHAKKVISGQVQDESFLPLLFETPVNENWQSDDWLRAANPGLPHGYPDWEGMVRYRKRCETSPSERAKFERRHLCKWLDGAANPAWDLSIWDENSGEVDLQELAGKRAWLACDLSTRIDLTAVAAAIELEDGRYALHVQSFTPTSDIRKRAAADDAPYPLWSDQGWLTPCPGATIDIDQVGDYVRHLCTVLDVREIAFDPHRAQDLMKRLEEDGYPCSEFPQTITVFAKPVNDFEELMHSRRLAHGGNPLLRWAVGNVVLHTDANLNRRPLKQRSKDRIDPAVAAIMAVGRAVAGTGDYDPFGAADFNPKDWIL